MLRALYREAERVALYLKRKDKAANVNDILKYKDVFKIEEDKKAQVLKPNARICAELLGVKDFYKQFNEVAAQNYGKEKHSVLRKHFEGYASGYYEPAAWVTAAALEVLASNNINVFDIGISQEEIKALWCRSNPGREGHIFEILGVLNFEA